jgi:hypothetical protein
MYSKVLFVGLGGSGGKTLRFIKREIERWLDTHEINSGVPAGWNFLWIDTPTQPDGGDIDGIAPRLEDTEYLGLVAPGAQLSDFVNALDQNREARDELRTWRINPAGVPVAVAMGAGQFRAIGQTIALASVQRIKGKFDEAFASINADGERELSDLYTKVNGEPPSAFQSHTQIVVVSSLAGGTGAGLLNTVCDVLRVHPDSNAARNIFGFLYTPEVFEQLGRASTSGVQPNSLAAISEILNGYWWGGDAAANPGTAVASNIIRPIVAETLQAAGLATPLDKSGPEYPFLIGRVGQTGIDHKDPNALFQLIGRSIVSLITDKNAGNTFFPFVVGNYAQNAINPQINGTDVLANVGGMTEGGTAPFQGVGFSRVSLGTDYFEEYTKRRIAKDAISHLTRYHSGSQAAQIIANDLQTDNQETITLKLAEPFLGSFLKIAGISEFGADDDILDALIPDDSDNLALAALNDAQRLSGQGTNEKKDINEWKNQIKSAIQQVLNDYQVKYRSSLNLKAQTWVRDVVPNQIASAIEHQLSNTGLAVTERVCRLAADYMREDTYEDLIQRDLGSAQKTFSEVNQYGVDQSFGGSEGKIEGNHELIDSAVRYGVRGIMLSGDIARIQMAAELCKSLADSVLTPAANALRDARERAEIHFGEINDYPEWNDTSPPESVLPPKGDFPLIDPSTYPETFSKLLSKTTELDGLDDVRTKVRGEVVSGSFLRKSSVNEKEAKDFYCVKYSQSWWPNNILAGGATQIQTNAVFSIDIGISELEERILKWLTRDGTPFSKYLKVSLRDYLGSTDLFDDNALTEREVQENQLNFINSCQAAVNASAPLLNIDAGLLAMVHPGYVSQPNHVFMSNIPLEGHELAEELKVRLIALGLDESKFHFVNDQTIKHIDITTVLPGPHSILVTESLLSPIAGAWALAGSPENFWSLRRAQRLERFAPVPQNVLLAMVRGWLIAGLLGRLERDKHLANPAEEPIKIRRSQNKVTVSFPNPFLSKDLGKNDHMALVLEALPLAYVQCSTLGNLSPLEPYIELRDLGKSPTVAALNSYDRFHVDISRWIETGELNESISNPKLATIDIDFPDQATDSFKVRERATALKKVLEDSRELHGKLFEKRKAEENQHSNSIGHGPQWHGLFNVIDRAHEDLLQAAENAARDYDDDTGLIN